jgi:hypothetical protein
MSFESFPKTESVNESIKNLRGSIDQCVAKIELLKEEESEDGRDNNLEIKVEERRLEELNERMEKLFQAMDK